MLLLDTCTLLWLVADQGQLSEKARHAMAGHPLFVSSITALEIGVKHRRKKLTLPMAPGRWFERVLEHHGIQDVPVDWRIAVASSQLPPYHLDPFDRIIIASAILMDLAVLTPDPAFRNYHEARVLW
jgi:PIN domain nuclease of toxin-antitoxin system